MAEANVKYAAVPIAKIEPDIALCSDVYVLVNDKYIKFKERNDIIPGEKYNFFLSKNIKQLYVEIGQLQDFMNWLKSKQSEKIDAIVQEVGEEYRPQVAKREELKEKIFETFANEEVSSETVTLVQGMVENIVGEVSKKQIPAHVLAKLVAQNSTIADHSVNVANLAVFFSMVLGHGHQFVLENIYMGALFHDYAKAKIPEALLIAPTSPKYTHAIQEHPEKGRALISQLDKIPEQVLTIVEQHHEQYSGKGYPKGLAEDKIYESALIVSMANVYDNTLTLNKGKAYEDRHKIAWKVLEYDNGKQFNPKHIPRIIDAVKLAFGNFTRQRKA